MSLFAVVPASTPMRRHRAPAEMHLAVVCWRRLLGRHEAYMQDSQGMGSLVYRTGDGFCRTAVVHSTFSKYLLGAYCVPGTAIFNQLLSSNRTLHGSAHKCSSSRAADGGSREAQSPATQPRCWGSDRNHLYVEEKALQLGSPPSVL